MTFWQRWIRQPQTAWLRKAAAVSLALLAGKESGRRKPAI